MLTPPEHTPAPSPGRSYYGFVLYLIGWAAIISYLIWALVPHKILSLLNVTYLPQPYWALAFPSIIITGLFSFVFFVYPAINLTLAVPPHHLQTICDSYSIPASHYSENAEFSVPPVYDLPISQVCRTLYS